MNQTSPSLLVTRLSGPVDSDPVEKNNPTWCDIEAAIRRLDGDNCSLVILGIGPPPVPHMAIGGGAEGKYIVYITPDNLIFHQLINPGRSSRKCMLVAGGQCGEYAEKLCVSLSEALRAAKSYAETGQPDASLLWETK